jgi:ligand-binding sensor domain-containing protein
MGTELLWAATGYGGVAQWDGQQWTNLDTPGLSQLLPIRQVTHIAEELVLGGNGGVAFLPQAGPAKLFSVPGQVLSLLSIEGDVWVNTSEGIFVLREEKLEPVLESPHCQGLFRGFEGAIWAQCDSLIELPVEAYVPGIELQWTIHDVELLPSGAWLGVEDIGLVWWEPSGVEHIGHHQSVRHITRSLQDLFISSGRGLVHLSGQDRRVYTQHDGLPSEMVSDLIPGPNEKVWVATDRGVALVDPHGVATPLPLAAAPTDVPVYDIAPSEMGVAMATARGLVWLGMRAPRNWSSFAAAVGPYSRSVKSSKHGWWAIGNDVIFQLDRSGQLHRWPRHSDARDLRSISVHDDQVLIQQGIGLRSWIEGATMLSPLERHDLDAAHLSPDGSLWMVTEQQVIQQFQGHAQDFDLPGVLDIAPDFGVAWAVSEKGLMRLGIDNSVTVITDEPHIKVAAIGDAVWRMQADGQLCGPSLTETSCYDLGQGDPFFDVYTLVADPVGVWVGTSRGAFRMLSPSQSK